jgi:ABC-type phosphate transport system ATPase subunit
MERKKKAEVAKNAWKQRLQVSMIKTAEGGQQQRECVATTSVCRFHTMESLPCKPTVD